MHRHAANFSQKILFVCKVEHDNNSAVTESSLKAQ